jgi:prenyltransferase beta subunit
MLARIKPTQVCYSWWCLSCLAILGRLHWVDQGALSRFILSCQVCVRVALCGCRS